MSQNFRISSGGRIDREARVSFTFDGKSYSGYHGDTLASGLLANGVHLIGRSFKYHRPRGILSSGSEEPNALVTIGTGDVRPLIYARHRSNFTMGLSPRVKTAGRAFGLMPMRVFNVFSRLLPAGFYYKTFKWPASLWTTYEHFIRAAAGMGKAPGEGDPDRYDKMHRHCDVLGGRCGPAGLAAALARPGQALALF